MAWVRVWEEVQLIAGYAKPRSLARSSIWLYTSGVAMGMMALLVRGFRRVVEQYLPNEGAPIPRALDRSTFRRRWSAGVAGHQGAEALVLLPAGQAAGQVGAQLAPRVGEHLGHLGPQGMQPLEGRLAVAALPGQRGRPGARLRVH